MQHPPLLVLPPDAVLVPANTLPEALKQEFEHDRDSYALFRAHSRSPSRIITQDTARLLDYFRTPSSIPDAIIALASHQGENAASLLEAAYPILRELVRDQFLVPPNSPLASRIDCTFQPGERVGSFQVIECIDLLNDTELYLVKSGTGTFGALKIVRTPSEENVKIRHEAKILRDLDGRGVPALLDAGVCHERPYLITSWCRGLDAYVAAQETRSNQNAYRNLRTLCCNLASAYAGLHQAGIIHGDVHPRNVIVDEDQSVILIDFGSASVCRKDKSVPAPSRGAVDLYLEPEAAKAKLAGEPTPEATFLGEQYSLAALISMLLTGRHTHEFSFERNRAFGQIAFEEPLAFMPQPPSVPPAVGEVIGKALSKEPADRFVDTEAFARELTTAFDTEAGLAETVDRSEPLRQGFAGDSGWRELIQDPIAAFNGINDLSLSEGVTGLSYLALRLALARQNPELLGLADVALDWAHKRYADREEQHPAAGAHRNAGSDHAPVSIFSSSAGLWLTSALVAAAFEDAERLARSVEALTAIDASIEPRLELMSGRSGLLLASARLMDFQPLHADDAAAKIRAFGNDVANGIIRNLEHRQWVLPNACVGNLGLAHGWAGVLYALLRWQEHSGTDLKRVLAPRLDQIATLARPRGRGIWWPMNTEDQRADDSFCASWCNGSAGYTHLWLTAFRASGDPNHLEFAKLSAWTSYEAPMTSTNMCCGTVGRAYSLLETFKVTGDEAWRERAVDLHARALQLRKDDGRAPLSLFKDRVSAELLEVELAAQDPLGMPMFETHRS
jgi:serine/threonine-protein kinase